MLDDIIFEQIIVTLKNNERNLTVSFLRVGTVYFCILII